MPTQRQELTGQLHVAGERPQNITFIGDDRNQTNSTVGKFKSSDTTKTTDTTIAADPHLAGWVIDPGKNYKMTGFLDGIQNVGNLIFNFGLTQTPQASGIFVMGSDVSSTFYNDTSVITANFSITTFVDTNQFGIYLSGHVVGHATLGGTIDFRWAQQTSSANNTTLRQGSWIEFTEWIR